MSISSEDYLLSRTLDPLVGNNWVEIHNMEVRDLASATLQHIEQELKVRVLITAGWALGGHNEGSLHYAGKAVDFVMLDPDHMNEVHPSEVQFATINKIAESYGFHALNEYANPSPAATGGHIHIGYTGGHNG